jgi:hypothetical protein
MTIDRDVEIAIIGYILLDDNRHESGKVLALLQPEDFQSAPHRTIWKGLRDLKEAGIASSLITLSDFMMQADTLDNVGGRPYLHACLSSRCSQFEVIDCVRIIQRHATNSKKYILLEDMCAALLAQKPFDHLEKKYLQILKETRAASNVKGYDANELELLDFSRSGSYMEPGIIPRKAGVLLTSMGKSYKSMVAMNLAFALACGVPFLGFTVPEPVKVMFIQGEISIWTMQDRVREMLKWARPEPGNLVFVQGRGLKLTRSQGFQAVQEKVQMHMPDVVFFDPLYKFHGGDENSVTEMKNVLDRFDDLIELYGVTVATVHHNRKDSSGSALDPAKIRGASVLFDYCDTSMRLDLDEDCDPPEINVAFTCRNAESPPPTRITMDKDTLWFFRPGELPKRGEWKEEDAPVIEVNDAQDELSF